MNRLDKNSKIQATIYWLVSFTWGCLMTIPGALAALFLLLTGHKPKRFGWSIYFNVGNAWGGLEIGPFFLTDSSDSYHTKCHEHGHGLQNVAFGPLFPFLISIPSSIRYWLREIISYKNKILYCSLIAFTSISVAVVGMVLGALYCKAVEYVFTGIFFYATYLSLWLFDEVEKYNSDNYPKYDDIWFEGNATKVGTSFMENK